MKKNHKSGQKVLNTRKDIASESPGSRAVIDDITERRRMEAEREEAIRALRKSEERYRALVMASPNAIYVHVDGFVTLANPAMARLLGADDPSRLLGKSVFELVDSEFHEIIRDRWRRISDGGSVPLIEEKFVRLDGSRVDVEVTAVALPLSGPREIQVIARDIIDRKRDEGLLRASSKRLMLALDSAKAGAWDWDVITGHIEWSPQMFDLFGLDRQTADASFESWRTRLHPEDLEPAERRIDEALKRQTILNSDYRLVLPDGGIRWINAVGEGVYDDQGRPVQMIGICQDITARKQAEEKLIASEKNFCQMFDISPVGIVMVGLDKRFVRCNHSFSQSLGYGTEELVGKLIEDITCPEDSHIGMAEMMAIMKGEIAQAQVYKRYLRKDGQLIWGEVTISLIRDPEGRAQYFLAIIQDVTARKQAEEKLIASEKNFRQIAENIKGVFWISAPDWSKIYYISPAYNDVWGEEAEKLYKQPFLWIDSIIEEDKEKVRSCIPETITKDIKEIIFPDYRIKKSDGAIIWISARAFPIFDSEGNPHRIAGIAEDITERVQAEIFIKDIIAQNPMSIQVLDKEGFTLEANPAHKSLFGSVPPADYSIFNDLQLAQKGMGEIFNQLRNGEVVHFPDVCYNPHDSIPEMPDVPAWVRTIGFPISDSNGKPERFILMHENITERKRAESQRAAALEEAARKAKELQEKNDELTRFTYAVSHDLRSPLVTVKTFLGHLEEDLHNRNQERVGEDFGFIKVAADKMGRLLDELLRLSRVGRIINPAVEVSLQAVVKEALDVTAGRIAQRGVRIEVTNEPVVLYGDQARLVEIFQNLVDNAAKFMGGQPEPRIEIGVESVDRETVLFVRDNGIGLDPKFEPRLFVLFEKLDAATDGVGLGLALVRRIVELHGGRIWAESEGPGRGATFRFTLAKTRWDSRKKDKI